MKIKVLAKSYKSGNSNAISYQNTVVVFNISDFNTFLRKLIISRSFLSFRNMLFIFSSSTFSLSKLNFLSLDLYKHMRIWEYENMRIIKFRSESNIKILEIKKLFLLFYICCNKRYLQIPRLSKALNENNDGNRMKIESSYQARRSFFSLNSFSN
jgi:hypothetical protein